MLCALSAPCALCDLSAPYVLSVLIAVYVLRDLSTPQGSGMKMGLITGKNRHPFYMEYR